MEPPETIMQFIAMPRASDDRRDRRILPWNVLIQGSRQHPPGASGRNFPLRVATVVVT